MARYIDAEKYEKDIIGKAKVLNDEIVFESNFVYSTLYQQPTADVVKVVRCKDCKRSKTKDGGIKCERFDGLLMIKPDDYCSFGFSELKECEGKCVNIKE